MQEMERKLQCYYIYQHFSVSFEILNTGSKSNKGEFQKR